VVRVALHPVEPRAAVVRTPQAEARAPAAPAVRAASASGGSNASGGSAGFGGGGMSGAGGADPAGPCADLHLPCFDIFDMWIFNPDTCKKCNAGKGCQTCVIPFAQ